VTYRLELSARAEADLAAACGWYADIRPDLEAAFLRCVQRALDRIAENPNAFRSLTPAIRYARMRRFPYGILYRVQESRIQVEGLFHTRRNPRLLRVRAGQR
jgi:plasmid stabilization system protein ParE